MKHETNLAGGIGLLDAREDLLTAGQYPHRGYISRVIVHHSGAPNPPSRSTKGLAGIQASARYVVQHRGWPGFAYHYWVPYHPFPIWGNDLNVLRGNLDTARSNHTGGTWFGESNNRVGVSICLQGNLYEDGPSHAQIECLEALLPWLAEQHKLDLAEALTWHSEAGNKATCPGPGTVEWLNDYRDRSYAKLLERWNKALDLK